MTRSGLFAVCAGAALLATPAFAAQLVANSGFESNPPDGSAIVDWTVTGDGIGDDQVFPDNGGHDAVFTPPTDDGGVLSQDLVTTPNVGYHLKFAVMSEGGSLFDTFTVHFGAFSAVIAGVDLGAATYVVQTFNVLPSDITSGLTTLSFQAAHSPDFGTPFHLDDVTVTSVGTGIPEPAAWALMIGGFGMAGAVLRRRSAKAPVAR